MPRQWDGRSPPPPLTPPSLAREHPSFSAALLDAIYHSLDADAAGTSPSAVTKQPAVELRRTSVSPAERPPLPHRRPPSTLSQAVSDVRSPRPPKPPRANRVRPDPNPSILPPPPPSEAAEEKEKKKSSASLKCRFKEFRNRHSASSSSSTTPIACLLKALFRKGRSTKAAPPPPVEPASARSILSSRASRRKSAAAGGASSQSPVVPARRAVRFSPVTVVVDEDCRGCGGGEMMKLYDADLEVMAPGSAAAVAERRVGELLRALGMAEEGEKAKESSDSSSDLFELDSLAAFEQGESPAAAGLGSTPTRAMMARPRPRVS